MTMIYKDEAKEIRQDTEGDRCGESDVDGLRRSKRPRHKWEEMKKRGYGKEIKESRGLFEVGL